jgi:uncharacterized membrane protein
MAAPALAEAAQSSTLSSPASRPARRDDAIDWLRGLVMAIMVLDHARDFWMGFRIRPTDLTQTTPILFATRFVTHYCAPVFVLLAGTAAYLYGRTRAPAERTRFLLSRGLFLVLLELTVIRLMWVPDPFYHFTVLQVIWAIGWSMIALAALCRAPRAVILAVGAALVLGHNAFDGVHAKAFGAFGPLWSVLHERAALKPLPDRTFFVSYPLVPWIGVMALGYALGPAVEAPAERRRDYFLKLGAVLTCAFFVLRAINHYGDPVAWTTQRSPIFSLLSFFNVEKYPPSLDYLLITLGPALALFAFAPELAARSRFLVTFGKVPLLFYVAHLFLLRYTSIPVAVWRFGAAATFTPPPRGAGGSPEFPLWVSYVVWLVSLVLLYPLCRWYARLKATKKAAWMSYL